MEQATYFNLGSIGEEVHSLKIDFLVRTLRMQPGEPANRQKYLTLGVLGAHIWERLSASFRFIPRIRSSTRRSPDISDVNYTLPNSTPQWTKLVRLSRRLDTDSVERWLFSPYRRRGEHFIFTVQILF